MVNNEGLTTTLEARFPKELSADFSTLFNAISSALTREKNGWLGSATVLHTDEGTLIILEAKNEYQFKTDEEAELIAPLQSSDKMTALSDHRNIEQVLAEALAGNLVMLRALSPHLQFRFLALAIGIELSQQAKGQDHD